jgi:hypothetical protein
MMARSTNAPFKGRIQKRKTNHLQIITFGLQRTAGPYKCANSGLILARIADAGVRAAVRCTTHRSVVAGFQKRNRNPTVGAMLLRWRKPEANPPFTCVNMTPR